MTVRLRRTAVVLAAVGALAVGGLPWSSAPGSSASAQEAEEGDLPVLGTFTYRLGNVDERPEVRGAVHGVRRVPGGTAVYYSLGVPAGESFTNYDAMPPLGLAEPYSAGDAYAVQALDPAGLRLYLPMVGPAGCLCSEVFDWGSEGGRLYAGWAVLPPLPAGVDVVNVKVGYGTVEAVPVEDGALLPASSSEPVVLGSGWPALPSDDDVAAVADPARHVRALVRHTSDLERTVTTNAQPGKVDEDLSADVLFAVGSATLSPAARSTLQQVGARVRERATGPVTVVGHTDSTGSDADNQRLSEARAAAVRDALAPQLGSGTPITASGRGEQEPVADETTPEGRQANRRVTVAYQVEDGS